MRKAEKERLIRKYNDIVEDIDMLGMSDHYSNYEDLGTADADEMDDEEVVEVIGNLSCNLDFLEGDLESTIDGIKVALDRIKQLKETKVAELDKLYDKYAA